MWLLQVFISTTRSWLTILPEPSPGFRWGDALPERTYSIVDSNLWKILCFLFLSVFPVLYFSTIRLVHSGCNYSHQNRAFMMTSTSRSPQETFSHHRLLKHWSKVQKITNHSLLYGITVQTIVFCRSTREWSFPGMMMCKRHMLASTISIAT